jgi:hypothetical protein
MPAPAPTEHRYAAGVHARGLWPVAQDDAKESREQPRDEPVGAEFDMQFVPSLPNGRQAVPAEREGKFVWLIAEGAMTEQCFREMREYLCHIVESGMWQQNWGSGGASSPALT